MSVAMFAEIKQKSNAKISWPKAGVPLDLWANFDFSFVFSFIFNFVSQSSPIGDTHGDSRTEYKKYYWISQ